MSCPRISIGSRWSAGGATLWKANAVNGVINIITRKSDETQGATFEIGGGNLEEARQRAIWRRPCRGYHLSSLCRGIRPRQRRLHHRRSECERQLEQTSGRFRADWKPSDDLITLQGDFYKGSEEQFSTPNRSISGQNILARWFRRWKAGRRYRCRRIMTIPRTIFPRAAVIALRTYDLDIQHNFSWGSSQEIVWGGSYRKMRDNFPTSPVAVPLQFFTPQSRSLGLSNAFAQI